MSVLIKLTWLSLASKSHPTVLEYSGHRNGWPHRENAVGCTTRAWPGADGADHLNGFGQVMSYVSDRFKGGGIWNRNGYDIYMYIYVHMYIYIYINVYIYIYV